MFDKVEKLMAQGVAQGVFPGGVILVARGGEIVFSASAGHTSILESRKPVSPCTFFDLASLTKPLATALAVMFLCARGTVDLTDPVYRHLEEPLDHAKKEITWLNLLCHNSGLPDYIPYHEALFLLPEYDRKHELYRMLCREPLVYSPGKKTVYSDIGFLFLQMCIESIVGKPFDVFVHDSLYRSLLVENLFFPLPYNGPKIEMNECAATEICPSRGVLQGIVHDENAYAIGGGAGHAGLFGTVSAVYDIVRKLLLTYKGSMTLDWLKPEVVSRFLSIPENAERTPGFDVPSPDKSSCGDYFNRECTVGHLGFTGTSFWVELDREIIVILLTNRVHPTRRNQRIKDFRPLVHNEVMRCMR